METIKLTSNEIVKVLSHMINNNYQLAQDGKVPVSIEIVGDPGLGKTSICKQVADMFNMECIKLNIAQFDDLCDLVGFPYKEFCLKNSNGDRIWVHENLLNSYVGTQFSIDPCTVPRMPYAIPEWIANRIDPVVLVLDDWTRADDRFIQAVMELVATQKYGSWSLPKGSTIILTSNPDDGENLVKTIDDAIRTRFISVEMKWSAECWAEWAEKNGVPDTLINFIVANPDIVNKSVNPRSIMNFFNSVRSIYNDEDRTMLTYLGNASVGPDFVETFKTFLDEKMDIIPSVKDMLVMNFDILSKLLKKCSYSGNEFSPAAASIVSTRIIVYERIKKNNKETVTDDEVSRIADIMALDVFTPDMVSYVANTLVNIDMKFSGLLKNKSIMNEILA